MLARVLLPHDPTHGGTDLRGCRGHGKRQSSVGRERRGGGSYQKWRRPGSAPAYRPSCGATSVRCPGAAFAGKKGSLGRTRRHNLRQEKKQQQKTRACFGGATDQMSPFGGEDVSQLVRRAALGHRVDGLVQDGTHVEPGSKAQRTSRHPPGNGRREEPSWQKRQPQKTTLVAAAD